MLRTFTSSGLPTTTAAARSVTASMSNTDASIDPLLRNIVSTPSTFHSDSSIGPVTPASFSQTLNYQGTSPYLQPENHYNAAGKNTENFHREDIINDPKRSRACEACRGLKVRCEPDPNNPDNSCKRCIKASRICVVTAPSRKRRKKTDSRVAELEKKIDALTASLDAQRSGNISMTQRSNSEDIQDSIPLSDQRRNNSFKLAANENFSSSYKTHFESHGGEWSSCVKADFESKTTTISSKVITDQSVKRGEMYVSQSRSPNSTLASSKKHAAPIRTWPDSTTKSTPTEEYTDVIDNGFITFEIASEIFDDFIRDMIPKTPILVFPPGTTSAYVRKSTPILFLAILSAGSSISYLNLQQSLTDELMRIFADRIIIGTCKNLELIQALQISSLWYWPVERYEELKFYQLRHIAAVMAIDIGMGRKNKSHKSKLCGQSRDSCFRNSCPDPETIESRRTWLSCYLLCCNAAMILRRPNIIQWSSFNDNCLKVLENSAEVYPSDKILCQWVKIHHIAEEIGAQFYMDDPGDVVNFSDPQVQHSLKGFERDLEKWRINLNPENTTPALKMMDYGINLYMHEIATHMGYQIDEFKTPFTEDTMRVLLEQNNHTPLSSARVTALSTCLVSIDGVIETFLNFDIKTILLLPVTEFGWIIYAIGVLMRLYFAAATPNSELGEVINKDNMKVEQYFNRLVDKLRTVSGGEKCRSSAKILNVLSLMRDWFLDQRAGKPTHHAVTTGSTDTPLRESSKKNLTRSELSVSSKKYTDFGTANTMLQLLSEVATGDSVGQSASSITENYSASANEWQQSSQVSYPGYHSGSFPVSQAYGQVQVNPNDNIDPSLNMDLDYTDMNGAQNTMSSAPFYGDMGQFLGDDALFGGLMSSVFQSNMVFEGS